jgi:hypothetical protein
MASKLEQSRTRPAAQCKETIGHEVMTHVPPASFDAGNERVEGFEIKDIETWALQSGEAPVAIRPWRENPRMHGQGKFRR